MPGESYYFIFSLIAFCLLVLYTLNAISLARTNKTLAGEEVTPKKNGYKKVRFFLSFRGIVIASVVGLGIIANLTYDVYRILHLGNPEYARGMLTYAPIIFGLFFIYMIISMRNKMKP